ncbi:MAG: 3-phosphoshikimate 1-carboxyvinyltransferase [Bacteroidia bacterium]|nr:3-phosphoshikimate 1-carboxyvinyltransferase [Bacteroidia bacterium]
MNYRVSHPTKIIQAEINLPSSKSISNRLLIISKLCGSAFKIEKLSESDDTRILEDALRLTGHMINVGNAGTAFRFLTAYLSVTPGEWILTGNERMNERPVGILADALNSLGAEISYLGKLGFPPLKIIGRKLNKNEITIDASVSSQFISALLLIAPVLPGGLTIHLKEELSSEPYIHLSLKLMNMFGISHSWKNNIIYIARQNYHPHDIIVEPDWSAASYWYEVAALSEFSSIRLNDLNFSGLQGDSVIAALFKPLGVSTDFDRLGAVICKSTVSPGPVNYDLLSYPDIALTLAVCMSHMGIPYKLKGLKNLRIKESNRITNLVNELEKTGIRLGQPAEGELEYIGNANRVTSKDLVSVMTYGDHRMAMAFAPVCLKSGEIIIENTEVVSKSYPGFWKEMERAGFLLSPGD